MLSYSGQRIDRTLRVQQIKT